MFLPTLFAAALAAPLAPDHHESPDAGEDVTALFDGEDVSAWEAYPSGEIPTKWRVEDDGSLHFLGKAGGGRGGDLMTKEAFENFDLRFEFKVSEGANSGVIYGVKPDPKNPPYMTGPEYQVLDDERHPDGKNVKNRVGALYAIQEARPFKVCPVDGSARCPHVEKTVKAVGEWNTGRIVKDGDTLRHYLNGEKVAEIEIGSDEWDRAIADSKFGRAPWTDFAGPLTRGEAGHIALQDHGDEVWYRDITVREPADDADSPDGNAASANAAGAKEPKAQSSELAAELPEPEYGTRAPRTDAGADGDVGAAGDGASGGNGAAGAATEPDMTAAETAPDAADARDWAAFVKDGSGAAGVTGSDLVNGSDWSAFLKRDGKTAGAGGVPAAEPVAGAGG